VNLETRGQVCSHSSRTSGTGTNSNPRIGWPSKPERKRPWNSVPAADLTIIPQEREFLGRIQHKEMNRRDFLSYGGIVPGLSLLRPARQATAQNRQLDRAAKMKRVGCTTVCFRVHFPSTRGKFPKPEGPDYDLLDMPSMMADRLGVHNVEVWHWHFAETTPAYAQKLRAAAGRVNSRIINIQLDGSDYDLSHPDPEARLRSVDYVQRWMDVARACGAASLRPNTGPRPSRSGKPASPFDLQVTGDSYRRLAEYGDKIGVKVLVENHGGYSAKVENILAIVKFAGRNCAALPDFGNFEGIGSDAERCRLLKAMFPYAYLVSAKAMYFNPQKKHISYDFGACVRTGEESGFAGIYSAEFWTPTLQPIDPWEAARLIIDMIVENI